MIWVTWRQHRTQAFACLALLGAVAMFAVLVGTWMRATFRADGIPGCLASSGGAGCSPVITSFVAEFDHGIGMVANLPLIAIPGIFGVVVGAPLLGRELERGTWRLAWTQTVPRTRWLVTKLGLVTAGLIVFGAAVTALMTWYSQPLDQVTSQVQPLPTSAEGPTFTASLLCAFALAVLAGLLLRNAIGGIVAAYVAWDITSAVILLLNGPIHILAPATMRIPCRAGCPGAGSGSVLPVTGHFGDFVLGIARTGGELVVTYLPASQFWPLQLIGSGLYLAIAVTALGMAVWLLHRRTT